MARLDLTKSTAAGSNPSLPIAANGLELVMTATVVADKAQFIASGNDIVIFHNPDVSAHTVTFTSVADPKSNRTGDITAYSVGAGKYGHFGPIKREGWMQTDGKIYCEANDTSIKFGVITLPQ